jgi:hypothetical protein
MNVLNKRFDPVNIYNMFSFSVLKLNLHNLLRDDFSDGHWADPFRTELFIFACKDWVV